MILFMATILKNNCLKISTYFVSRVFVARVQPYGHGNKVSCDCSKKKKKNWCSRMEFVSVPPQPYLKAHIFVTFHCFVQVFLPRKYSAVSSLALDYITLPYIANDLPLCSQCLFLTICLQWCFQKKIKSLFEVIRLMKKQGDLRIKFWKDHSSKNWTYTSVKKLLKRFKDNSKNRWKYRFK